MSRGDGEFDTEYAGQFERLVRIAAEQETPAARHRFFKVIRHAEVFFPLRTEQQRATPLLRLPDGTHAMMLYTTRSHPDLVDNVEHGCGGGSFTDALSAASTMAGLDWVILSNRTAQWVAIRKQEIPGILADLESPPDTPETPESLITRAARCGPGDASPPIAPALAGRELFVELTSGPHAGDHPIMKVFEVDGLPAVIRAFLTRNRPGITYGGMRWEAVAEMIGNAPGIDGVQVVNDADDWVVFDRESLGVSRLGCGPAGSTTPAPAPPAPR
ncbi:MAG: hypothetical protein WCI78_06635 [Mycobacterium sp.]